MDVRQKFELFPNHLKNDSFSPAIYFDDVLFEYNKMVVHSCKSDFSV